VPWIMRQTNGTMTLIVGGYGVHIPSPQDVPNLQQIQVTDALGDAVRAKLGVA
jgi:hypothetical protein